MRTSLHAPFNVVFGNVYFLIFIVSIRGRKKQFSESSQTSISKKSILVILRSFFSMYKFFPARGWLLPVSMFQEEYFNGKMSSLAGLKKII